MADQPAKALIIYGDGFMRQLGAAHSHLHGIASAGSCGFLALRSQTSKDEDERVVEELAQLLDLCDDHQNVSFRVRNGEQLPSMAERFMKLRAGFLSNCSLSSDFAKKAGFTLLSSNSQFSSNSFPDSSTLAAQLLGSLGLQENDDDHPGGNCFELVLLHLKANSTSGKGEEDLVDWTDRLVDALQNSIPPGSKAKSHLYLVLVMGYGFLSSSEDEYLDLSVRPNGPVDPKLESLVPKQSYMIKSGRPVEGIREHHPLLVAHYRDGVTRRDEVNSFTFNEFKQKGGSLTILVDRFLHEVAFKLWRAPKYGA